MRPSLPIRGVSVIKIPQASAELHHRRKAKTINFKQVGTFVSRPTPQSLWRRRRLCPRKSYVVWPNFDFWRGAVYITLYHHKHHILGNRHLSIYHTSPDNCDNPRQQYILVLSRVNACRLISSPVYFFGNVTSVCCCLRDVVAEQRPNYGLKEFHVTCGALKKKKKKSCQKYVDGSDLLNRHRFSVTHQVAWTLYLEWLLTVTRNNAMICF